MCHLFMSIVFETIEVQLFGQCLGFTSTLNKLLPKPMSTVCAVTTMTRFHGCSTIQMW